MGRKKNKRRRKNQEQQQVIEKFQEKFELDKRSRKGTARAISRRRADVWEMMCQGVPMVEMAELLSVSRTTIFLDMRYWNDKVSGKMANIKNNPDAANIELGRTMKMLESVAENAFAEYSMSKSGNEKDKFLNTATRALAQKIRILQEAGYLPKAGVEINAKVEHGVSFAKRFGDDSALSQLDDPVSRHKILKVAEKVLKMANVLPETIEGEVVVKNPSIATEGETLVAVDDDQ